MSSCDQLKAEKADAMRRFRRKRNVFFCLQLAGALALVLFCCSFAWIHGFKGLASDHPSALKFCAFLLIHVIVLLVYLLSTDNSSKENDAAVGPDLSDRYVSFSSSALAVPSCSNTTVGECKQLVVSPAPETLSERVAFRNKQIAASENVEHSPTEGKHRVRELGVVANDCAAVKVQEEVKHYRRRTRSELSAREKTSRRRQLRRWETENQRQLAVADRYCAARKSMEDMDSEEFKHTIESFIATKKKILMDENRADGHRLLLI